MGRGVLYQALAHEVLPGCSELQRSPQGERQMKLWLSVQMKAFCIMHIACVREN